MKRRDRFFLITPERFNAPGLYLLPDEFPLELISSQKAGAATGNSANVGLFVHLHEGDHDDQLPWPFNLDYTVQLGPNHTATEAECDPIEFQIRSYAVGKF